MSRILVVEDNQTVRDVLCDLLTPHECQPVGSSEEGLALLDGGGFDLVITDVRLPGMGGEEFLRAVRRRTPETPVIVITGADGDEAKFMDAGAFGFLLKPFLFEEVEELVARALERRE